MCKMREKQQTVHVLDKKIFQLHLTWPLPQFVLLTVEHKWSLGVGGDHFVWLLNRCMMALQWIDLFNKLLIYSCMSALYNGSDFGSPDKIILNNLWSFFLLLKSNWNHITWAIQ